MMVDVEQIRAALAAATPAPWSCWNAFSFADRIDMMGTVRIGTIDGDGLTASEGRDIHGTCADLTLVANAPVWLASLCDEIERLRVHAETVIDDADSRIIKLRAERDATLAEVALLKTTTFSENVAVVQKQLAAALAECERLRKLPIIVKLAEAREIADGWGEVFEVDAEGDQIMVDPEDAWNNYGGDDEVLWDTICPTYGELKRFWAARDRWRARSWADAQRPPD